MVKGFALFPGPTVEDTLNLIFCVLGTPSKDTWPNLKIPDTEYYERDSFSANLPQLDQAGVDLLEEFLRVRTVTIVYKVL